MTDSLQATDDYSAALATGPRVTLESMKQRVVECRFFTAGEAVSAIENGAGRFTLVPKQNSPLHLLTICVLLLDNGWTMVGKSAPASAENFDYEKGRTFAYEDAIRQLWPLEGYLLRNELAKPPAGMRRPSAETPATRDVVLRKQAENYAAFKVADFAESLARKAYGGQESWQTAGGTTYVAFINGREKNNDADYTEPFGGSLDQLVVATIMAIQRYRDRYDGPVDLAWRRRPEITKDINGKTTIYLRFAFEPAWD